MINDQYRSQYRLPYALYERLKAEADAQKRSLNAEIVLRLEASFSEAVDPIDRLIKTVDERNAKLLEEVRTLLSELPSP